LSDSSTPWQGTLFGVLIAFAITLVLGWIVGWSLLIGVVVALVAGLAGGFVAGPGIGRGALVGFLGVLLGALSAGIIVASMIESLIGVVLRTLSSVMHFDLSWLLLVIGPAIWGFLVPLSLIAGLLGAVGGCFGSIGRASSGFRFPGARPKRTEIPDSTAFPETMDVTEEARPQEPPSALSSIVSCPGCGADNAFGSLECRKCGQSLQSQTQRT